MSKWVRSWEVPSSSSPDKEPYIVSQAETGEFGCTCPRWRLNRNRPECRHIRLIKGKLALAGQEKAVTKQTAQQLVLGATRRFGFAS